MQVKASLTNLKEVRLQFRTEALVGIGNGMLYCIAVDVIDTQIQDASPEYSTPSIKKHWMIEECIKAKN